MALSRYNKLISVVIGNVVGFALVWLATKTPMATCAAVDGKTVCTLLGMSQAELTGVVMALITSIAVAVGPRNSLTPMEAVKEAEAATVRGEKLVKNVELNPSPEAAQINAETGPAVKMAATPSPKR